MNNMDATVLVPSKLRDMDNIGLKTERHIIPSTFSNIANQTNELHNFFIMLNDVKKELLWGCSTSSTITSMAQSSSPISSSSSSTSHEFVYNNHRRNSTINNNTILFNRSISVQSSLTNQSIINNHNNSSILAINKQHSRQSSQEDCLGSIGSSVSSSSDTESDADSMLTDSIEDSTSHLFVSFRHHLQGLHSILNQLADSADFLSVRYQEEIGDI
ncbi:hypothetical protein DERP_004468 [Dermatophagoides pteronyssinus]|nr:hypothetical protein DERP_004468 [Dermatophagoides pteronyssinus]